MNTNYIEVGPWTCAECGETGDPDEQTFREHIEEEHGGLEELLEALSND